MQAEIPTEEHDPVFRIAAEWKSASTWIVAVTSDASVDSHQAGWIWTGGEKRGKRIEIHDLE
jgi:hypothetical protein